MIVCHCNRISANDIEEAVGCLMTNCAGSDLCPEKIYGELDQCPRCCCCFPLAEKMIKEAQVRFVSRSELIDRRDVPISIQNTA